MVLALDKSNGKKVRDHRPAPTGDGIIDDVLVG